MAVSSFLKNSESFDAAQDERKGIDIINVSVPAEVLEAFRTFFQQPSSLNIHR
jgi:hypothetical protein